MTDYYSHLGLKYKQRTIYKNSILERDNHTCQLCGEEAQEVDHIIPWGISHDSSPTNLRAICIKCNRSTRRQRKDANPFRSFDDWYDYIKRELVNSAAMH